MANDERQERRLRDERARGSGDRPGRAPVATSTRGVGTRVRRVGRLAHRGAQATVLDGVWRPARLTADQREERRLVAARLFERGQLSQAEIARRLGVTPGAVSHWYNAWKQGGHADLKAKPRPGRRSRLTPAEWEKIGHMLERGPMAAGFDAPGWTLERIAMLIQAHFDVEYHPRYLERPLRKLGFTVRPQTTWTRDVN
jgi:transposase